MTASQPGRSTGAGPPLPRLTLRVGVTGHRPNHLHGADSNLLRADVREVLELVRRVALDGHVDSEQVYSAEPPLLRIVSSLAEGADRLVAQEALALGYQLECPLPFERSAYELDFAGDASIAEYHALLTQARSVLELDGSRETPERQAAAYTAAGHSVLDHADVMLAVWDGREARGAGGTAEIVRAAMERGVPTVRIDSHPPHRACLLSYDRRVGSIEEEIDGLSRRLRSELVPPWMRQVAGATPDESDPLRAYLSERQPRFSAVGWAWGVFTSLVADLRPRLPRLRVKTFERETAAKWRQEWGRAPALPDHMRDQIDLMVQRAYAWADGLAVYYANGYRSASVLSYGLGLLATMLAIAIDTSSWIGRHELAVRLLRTSAFLSVLCILFIWFAAHRRHWHDRWIDYRLLAELLRQMRFLTLLGRPPAFSTPPGESVDGRSRGSWPGWYLRAMARQAGLPDARLEPNVLEATRILLKESLVASEARYHLENARRLGRMDDRLRAAGSLFFVVALVALGTLVLRQNSWITGVAALLPVFGGAFAAVRSQAELARVVKRSRAMAIRLQEIGEDLAEQGVVLSSSNLARAAEAAAQAMIAEVLDWQIVFEEKPLELGG